MAPVAFRLRELGFEQVVLIPVGLLALVPLHATRYHVGQEEICFLDEFTVSYSPNARVLAMAKRESHHRTGENRLVGVGNPLPHPRPLLAAQAELEEIATLFPEKAHRLLFAEAANRNILLEVISEGTYLHFACHGVFDTETPLNSHLELSNGELLTLKDVLYGAAQPAYARLAVISACQSAISDFLNIPDEVIGLLSGFLQAGIPGVVGTLWAVDDLSSALVVVKFYEFHLRGDEQTGKGPMPPAEALRRAQIWLRNVTNDELADYFETHPQLKKARHQALTRMSKGTELADRVRLSLDDAQARPFADKPYHWAPFIFLGA